MLVASEKLPLFVVPLSTHPLDGIQFEHPHFKTDSFLLRSALESGGVKTSG